MYEYSPAIGSEFQPMVNGVSEIFELQRAAVYYSFPGYVERIRDFGFVGIEIKNHKLIEKSLEN